MTKPKSVTAKQILALDREAIETIGIPSLVLMDHAGRAVADLVVKKCQRKGKPKIVIVCGTGNNGGDGFVVARYLSDQDYEVAVVLVEKDRPWRSDSAVNFGILKRLKIPVLNFEANRMEALCRDADCIVDAMFGVGLNRALEGQFAQAVAIINASSAYIVAVDVPSGLDATTGAVHGCCVKADTTVTFSMLKCGFLEPGAQKYCGRVIVKDIGLPKQLLRKL